MAIKKMPIGLFVEQLGEALERKDGYIMGATGQNPRKWKADSWWFTQYNDNPKQKKQALYWREHAARVWDCNGLAEGLYKDYTGVDINSKARYNYQQWCDPKGSGMIPAKYRVPGAAVFWGDTASDIHHVAFLYKPVNSGATDGDWYLIEARGVMYGVVETKLLSRKPDFWGWMTKYFDYGEAGSAAPTQLHLGDRLLKNGMSGPDVKELQENLIRLGYDCGRYGADGDFGDATEEAVKQFQRSRHLTVDGEFGEKSFEAMEKALAQLEKPVTSPSKVVIAGGRCYVREQPDKTSRAIGVAQDGEHYAYAGETTQNGWNKIDFKGKIGWVSGKYSKLIK